MQYLSRLPLAVPLINLLWCNCDYRTG
jgi:hypothetical protein